MSTSNKERFAGVDFFRGLGAYAVVILHANPQASVQSPTWLMLQNLSDFAVPFFLAASFYFTVGKASIRTTPTQWGQRIKRLMLPYLFWSLTYLGFRILRYGLDRNFEEIIDVFKETLVLLILGQAGFAFHLYFVPLLLTGTIMLILMEPQLQKRISSPAIVGLIGISLGCYQIYSETVLSIIKSDKAQVHSLIYILAIAIGYLIRCLPYILTSWLLHRVNIQQLLKPETKSYLIPCLGVVFLGINLFGATVFPKALNELTIAYSTLLLALGWSNPLLQHKVIQNMSNCSFGIYLMHLLWIDLIWIIFKRMDWAAQLSVSMLLAMATLVFLASWGTTNFLIRRQPFARIMFGT
jgi:peptidoglycan/LPS O-acetylase OafA/YrhL